MINDVRIRINKIYKEINKIAMLGRDYEMDFKNYIDDLIRKNQYSDLQSCLEVYYNIDTKKYDNINVLKYKSWQIILEKTKSSFIDRLGKLYKSNNVYQQANGIYSESEQFSNILLSYPLDSSYVVTSTHSQIALVKNNTILYLDINDSNVNRIEIYRNNWDNQYPINNVLIQNITVGTHSSFPTQIPLVNGGTYLIKTESKNPYNVFNYKVNITISNQIGTIDEIDIQSYLKNSIYYSSVQFDYYYKNTKMQDLLNLNRTFLEVQKTNSSVVQTMMYDDPNNSEEMNLYKRYQMAIEYLLS